MKIYPNQDLQHQDCGCPGATSVLLLYSWTAGDHKVLLVWVKPLLSEIPLQGEPGTEARVYDITGGPQHVLDFVIPRGQTGIQGLPGEYWSSRPTRGTR